MVCSFFQGSWFEGIDPSLRGNLDVVVSNPPYIAADERPGLDPVLDYEPEMALVAPDGSDGTPGFADVEFLIRNARTWLRTGGLLALEMAEHQVPVALELADASGYGELRGFADLAGKPRGIVGKLL